MAGELEKLRDELIEFEKAISEFQKWKLIGIGAVFATGLGLESKCESSPMLALLAVPMLTVYADLLIRDCDIRLCLIASYMRPLPGVFGDYERFLRGMPERKHWIFGHIASICSSIVANVAVVCLAIASATDFRRILIITAVFGVLAAIATHAVYGSLVRRIFKEVRPMEKS